MSNAICAPGNYSAAAATNIDLVQRILANPGTEQSFEHFADDVVLEFPYGTSLGMPDRFEGKEIAVNYLRQMLSQFKGLKLYNFRSYPVEGDPDTVFNEYEGEALTPGGNTYTQTYMNKMQFRDGKLILIKELWDPMKVVKATNGEYDGNVKA